MPGSVRTQDLRLFAAHLGERFGCGSIPIHDLGVGQTLPAIRTALDNAPIMIATAPEHRRAVLRETLEAAGLRVLFWGRGRADGVIAIAGMPSIVPEPPRDFRVMAFMSAYNEEDVIAPVLEHLIGQGVEVHVVDNWSTDRTVERAAKYLGLGVRTITHFPEAGPTGTYDWYDILSHIEVLSWQSGADWIIHHDADEIRESPWPELTIRQTLYLADQNGFNAIDHTCAIFHPTGSPYREDLPLQPQFQYFEFGARPGHFLQIKGWKRQSEPVQLASSGGHEAVFSGRRVYPFKFLLRHYPIRSQAHGERKVLVDRVPRFNRTERERRGWHIQYDHMDKRYVFVQDPETLEFFDPASFYERYLMERLSGVGVRR